MKRFCAVLCLSGVCLSVLLPAYAAAPTKVSELISVEDLVTEAKDRVEKLKESVASEEAFKKAVADKMVGRDAGILAVAAQGLVEHDKGKDAGISAASLRDAAVVLRRAKTQADAKVAVDKAVASLEGKGDAAAVAEYSWNKLTGMHAMMDEIEARQTKLRGALAKPRNLVRDSRHASLIALLAVAMEEDTHEVKKPEEIPQWKAMAKEYRDTMSQISVAMKAGDGAKANELFKTSGQSCTACHEKFRDTK